jgi:hypothetical protein
MAKYIFKEDFEAIGISPSDENRIDVRSIKLKHKFKKGEVFEGKLVPTNAGVNPDARAYNVQIFTPNNYTEDDNFVYYNGVFEVPEMLVREQTFLEKNKTNLLILGGLVVAYFAYKKFNK